MVQQDVMDALNEGGFTATSAAPGYGPTTTWEMLRADPLDPPKFCHDNDTMYEPIDMNYSMTGSSSPSIELCQMLCRQIDSCGYYTWYEPLKSCHLALPTAQKVTGRPGFQAGPAACDGAQQGADDATVKAQMMKDTCLVTNLSYWPLQSRDHPASTADDPVECQNQCANVSWCAHFVYNTLLKICNLQDSDAQPTYSAAYQIAGPPSCSTDIQLDITLQEIAVDAPQTMRGMLADKAERAIFMTILKSAISTFVGDYIPYTNGEAGNATQLLPKSDMSIEVKDGGDTDTEMAVLTLTIDVPPERMFYISELIQSKAVSGLDTQIERFMKYVGGQFSSEMAAMQIHVLNFSNATQVSKAGNFTAAQQAAFQQFFQMEEPAEGNAVSDVTMIVTVVTAAIFIVLLASYVALSRSARRNKTGHCQIIDETDDPRIAMVTSRTILLPGTEDNAEVFAAGEIA